MIIYGIRNLIKQGEQAGIDDIGSGEHDHYYDDLVGAGICDQDE
jgi:hypothetical protein